MNVDYISGVRELMEDETSLYIIEWCLDNKGKFYIYIESSSVAIKDYSKSFENLTNLEMIELKETVIQYGMKRYDAKITKKGRTVYKQIKSFLDL